MRPPQALEFYQALLDLHKLKTSPDDLSLLICLQRKLIRKITWTERAILRGKSTHSVLKARLSKKQNKKSVSLSIKNLIRNIAIRKKKLEHDLFLWRCIGDGIASIYQNIHALKHLFYDHQYAPKESAGFISGKKGFRKEWSILKMGINHNVPVLLSDLTNIIRVGDVCALADHDPVPIEVKSSNNSSKRRSRQEAHMRNLAKFYSNDEIEDFRGSPTVKRFELKETEINYYQEINSCIKNTANLDFLSTSPEPGLIYIVAKSQIALDQGIQKLLNPTTLIQQLSPEQNWLPSYPFTLSLTPENSYIFSSNRISIFVLIDLSYLKFLFSQHGVTATFIMQEDYAIQLCLNPTNLKDGACRVSDLLLGRIGTEFQSLKWFAAEFSQALKENYGRKIETKINFDFPEDWTTARDCWLLDE